MRGRPVRTPGNATSAAVRICSRVAQRGLLLSMRKNPGQLRLCQRRRCQRRMRRARSGTVIMNPISAVENFRTMVSCDNSCKTVSMAIAGGIGILLLDARSSGSYDAETFVRLSPVLNAGQQRSAHSAGSAATISERPVE